MTIKEEKFFTELADGFSPCGTVLGDRNWNAARVLWV